MAKSEGQRGVISIGGSTIGVRNFNIDTQISEIDVTDTETTSGESEFLGSKKERNISFQIFKNATVAGLTLNSSLAANIKVYDAAGNYTQYAGNIILLGETVSGDVNEAVTVDYTGRWLQAITETQTPAV